MRKKNKIIIVTYIFFKLSLQSNIDFFQMKEITNRLSLLFICLGNICRSPAAEGVMKKMSNEHEMGNILEIDSAGIGNWHVGQLPDARMREHALRRGYVLDSRARQFSERDLHRFDLIIVMDEENYREISSRTQSTEEKAKIVRMKDYFLQYRDYNCVPDPYYGGAEDFELALDLIEDGCKGILQKLSASQTTTIDS